MTLLTAAALVWWLEIAIDAREVDGIPDWRERLDRLLAEASQIYTAQDHPLDVACPVELRPWSITVYRPGVAGWTEGGGKRPDVQIHREPFERTHLYLAPGPGWAIGHGAGNWAYAWIGYWCPTAKPDCPNGRDSGGVLIDPWGRGSRAWAVAHELGHAARLPHRGVQRPEDCSLMAYGPMLQVDCPNNGRRLTRADCDAIQRRARERPEPAASPVPVHRVAPRAGGPGAR